MSRYFDTVIKAFVDESKVDFNNKERFIEDRETDLQVVKGKKQITLEKSLIIQRKELELGRPLTTKEKKAIKVDRMTNVYENDILADAYCPVCYIGYCEKCRSFEPFSLSGGCLACTGQVKLFELKLSDMHISGNTHLHKKQLMLIE